MNLSNISVNKIVKSYKEMCQLLNEPTKGGTAKAAQVKDWERYFAFHRLEGKHAFVIDKIYDKPLPQNIRANDIYTPLIKPVLCDLIRHSDNYVFTTTRQNLYERLGMFNEHFIEAQSKQDIRNNIQQDNKISPKQMKWMFNKFCVRVYRANATITNNVLKRLQTKLYIVYDECLKYYINGIEYIANPLEKIRYDEIVRELKALHHIVAFNGYNIYDFYTELDKLLFNNYGWERTILYQTFTFADSYKLLMLSEPEQSPDDITRFKLNLNSQLIQKFNSEIELEANQIEYKGKQPQVIIRQKYIDIQHQLLNAFIKI